MQWYKNDSGSRLCLLYVLRTRPGGERRGKKGHLSPVLGPFLFTVDISHMCTSAEEAFQQKLQQLIMIARGSLICRCDGVTVVVLYMTSHLECGSTLHGMRSRSACAKSWFVWKTNAAEYSNVYSSIQRQL